MKNRSFTVFLVVIGLLLTITWVIAAERIEQNNLPIQASNDRINLNLDISDPTVDPALAGHYVSFFVVDQLFMGLVRVEDETGNIVPDLATSWESSPDADMFTFTLRSDATWSDGTPVTASDVSFGIHRSLAPDTNAIWASDLFAIQGARDYNEGAISLEEFEAEGSIVVLDNTHIRFLLSQPTAHFPSIMALPVARAMPAGAIAAHADFWTEPGNIVTNGPYLLSIWTHGTSLTLSKNPNYFDADNVQIDQVQFTLADEDVAWSMYQAGQLDSAIVPEDQWSTVKNDPLLQGNLRTATNSCTYFFAFNSSKPPFDEVLVRKAFIAVIDRQDLINDILAYAQQPALTFTPPGIFGHVDGAAEGVGIPYNPAQAQQWLIDAGYPGGGGLGMYSMKLLFPTGAFSPHNLLIAEYAHLDWMENFGVDVRFESRTAPVYTNLILNNMSPHIWVWRSCGRNYSDASTYLYRWLVPFNDRNAFGNWNDAAYLGFLNQAAQTADPNERKLLYKLAEKTLVEDEAVIFPIYYEANGVVTRSKLKRTIGRGGVGGYIADWRVNWRTFLPAVVDAE